MRRSHVAQLAGLCASLVLTASCAPKHQAVSTAAGAAVNENLASITPEVHTIYLPHYQPNLPEAPGRDVFASNCLSCHTSLYVTQQATSFDQAKWESEVKKMIKPYGAPIAEGDVATIAKYIVQARKINPGVWESQSPTPPAVNPSVAAAMPIQPGNADQGKILYTHYCASCHGDDGKSDTRSARALLPRPTDLTANRFASSVIVNAITRGVRGAAMPAFPTLKASQIADLVAYTQQFSSNSEHETPSANLLAQGKTIYNQSCASCHGENGAGDGYAAAPLARRPADFHTCQPSSSQAVSAIANGVGGTAMPAWQSKFDKSQQSALAQYVRGFFVSK